MIRKLLIANRGEIACRVARTAKRLGIATVAVYSDADRNALHVRSCDEAVHIGGAAARESYLNMERILAAARHTGADAIHPGYGFLSENAAFAEACQQAGIVFVGPQAASIRAMGSKSEAKALMERAGVPLVPGYHGADQQDELLVREAARIGYPVLIKASAGGGGKGMRIVHSPDDFLAQLAACRREAAASFGDERVLIEKYLIRPRHIEFQVFGDTHGQCVHLWERDCSVQRRHQKVLEEAPAPGMTHAVRARMGHAAVAAAQAVDYVGAGTIEFIVAADGAFYFMEMNTRLQVEHPVTEMITGFDLVEWQLRVAAGEPLPVQQADITAQGHAIEARVYAEDAARGFLPSIGHVLHLAAPDGLPHVRVDTGVAAGDEITPYYDPMIAKLIVWGADRAQALARMSDALQRYQVVGVTSNLDFLARLVATRSFAQPELDTSLIEREAAALFAPTNKPSPRLATCAALLEAHLQDAALAAADATQTWPTSPWAQTSAWRMNLPASRRVTLESGAHMCVVELGEVQQRQVTATHSPAACTVRAELGGELVEGFGVRDAQDRWHVFSGTERGIFARPSPTGLESEAADGAAHLRAPMPGRVIRVCVSADDVVAKGTPLIVVEAMKMEHTLVAPADGRVLAVHFATGDTVKEGADLIEFIANE
jgi:3-methylcrotonyl-CoA carboxylase alpha subunit